MISILGFQIPSILASNTPASDKNAIENPSFVPGEIIIKFKTETADLQIKKDLSSQGVDFEKQKVSFDTIESSSLPEVMNTVHKKYTILKVKKMFTDTVVDDRKALNNIYHLTLTADAPVEEIVRVFKEDSQVEFVHPNYLMKLNFTPNDPYFLSSNSWGQGYDDLWALKSNRLNLEPAWDITKGKTAT